jgi:hypothetical protein
MTTVTRAVSNEMVTLAALAMRDLRADILQASGCSDMEALAIHRVRTERLFAPGNTVDRFNALLVGTDAQPVVMMSSIWPCVHADTVSQMVSAAAAMTVAD